MKKSLLIGIVLLLIAVGIVAGVYFDLGSTREESSGSTVTRSGVVVEVNKEETLFDGPYRLTIESSDGKRSMIAVPSMGLPLCAAYKNGTIKDPYSIEVGASIQVSGTLSEDGSIIPCDSVDHYLR
ncbi:MAG: hypothetical protein AAB365_01395 [Patescibacteria group bacterium]